MNQPEPAWHRKFTPEQSRALCKIYRILLESEPRPVAPVPESDKKEKLTSPQTSQAPPN